MGLSEISHFGTFQRVGGKVPCLYCQVAVPKWTSLCVNEFAGRRFHQQEILPSLDFTKSRKALEGWVVCSLLLNRFSQCFDATWFCFWKDFGQAASVVYQKNGIYWRVVYQQVIGTMTMIYDHKATLHLHPYMHARMLHCISWRTPFPISSGFVPYDVLLIRNATTHHSTVWSTLWSGPDRGGTWAAETAGIAEKKRWRETGQTWPNHLKLSPGKWMHLMSMRGSTALHIAVGHDGWILQASILYQCQPLVRWKNYENRCTSLVGSWVVKNMKTTASAETVEHPSGRVCWNSPWIAPFWVDVLGKPQKNQCVCNSSAPTALSGSHAISSFFLLGALCDDEGQGKSSDFLSNAAEAWTLLNSSIVWHCLVRPSSR